MGIPGHATSRVPFVSESKCAKVELKEKGGKG